MNQENGYLYSQFSECGNASTCKHLQETAWGMAACWGIPTTAGDHPDVEPWVKKRKEPSIPETSLAVEG